MGKEREKGDVMKRAPPVICQRRKVSSSSVVLTRKRQESGETTGLGAEFL
jgi:hypothetical protein